MAKRRSNHVVRLTQEQKFARRGIPALSGAGVALFAVCAWLGMTVDTWSPYSPF